MSYTIKFLESNTDIKVLHLEAESKQEVLYKFYMEHPTADIVEVFEK